MIGLRSYLVVMLKGTLMGTADVVPGVSGGTIAFITGIYAELLKTIDGLDLGVIKSLKDRGIKQTVINYNLGFLMSLLLGVLLAIASLSRLIIYLLTHYRVLVWAFFFGLVVSSILYIGKQVKQWSISTIGALILGSIFSYYITIAEPLGAPDSWWYLIFSGFIAIIAMILPGVSGAFLLLLLGSYATIIGSISSLFTALSEGNWPLVWDCLYKLGLFALGCLLGLKVFSKALTWLFKHKENITLAILTGFMIGSLNKLWPWKLVQSTRINSHGEEVPFLEKSILPSSFEGDPQILLVTILAIIGFLLIYLMEKWASAKKHS